MAAGTQAHIHLQGTDDKGTGWPSPEYVPTNTYKVVALGYQRRPQVFVATERALDGTLHIHRLQSAGSPEQALNYTHVLKVSHSELTELLTEVGKTVDFVDNYHNDDGEDSSSFVREMVLVEVRQIRPMIQDLSYYTVQVVLEDNEV